MYQSKAWEAAAVMARIEEIVRREVAAWRRVQKSKCNWDLSMDWNITQKYLCQLIHISL